jgi:predicted ATP-grasp superfamily ATP-dependent carboligase
MISKTKTRKTEFGSVTGRDGYILAQALAYAIEVIGSLPEDRQERSNREDMKKIFEAMFSEQMREIVTYSARCHLNPDVARELAARLQDWSEGIKAKAAIAAK